MDAPRAGSTENGKAALVGAWVGATQILLPDHDHSRGWTSTSGRIGDGKCGWPPPMPGRSIGWHAAPVVTRHRPGRAFRAGWWAGGLNLIERLPAPTRSTSERTERSGHERRRVERWSAAHAPGGLAERLAAVGTDPVELAGLVAEPAESLVGRREQPEWAAFVERTLDTAIKSTGTGSTTAVPEDGSWPDVFAAPLRPLVDEVCRRIAHACADEASTKTVDLDAVCADVSGWLSQRLARLAARTFVLELNLAREAGRLTGETGRQRFTDFARQLTDGALAGMMAAYPVLARLLGQTCLRTVDATVELVRRFAADRPAIVDELLDGIDPGRLVGVDVARGDLHRGGRAVAFLRFANGATVVHKPRGSAAQRHFGELVEWLNGKVPGLGLRTPACVVRPGYGWTEFVAHRSCTSQAQLDRFYRRQGALLALLYAVDCADMHYENVIACRDQPMLVDVETLFQPSLPVARAMADPAAAVMESSVLRVALLPMLLFGQHGALDISGLGGDEGATFPNSMVDWEAAGTDEMRLVRRPAPFGGADNRPRLHGRVADPGEHRAALLDGFRAGYDAIVRHQPELTSLLVDCADYEIRVLVRPTQRYATLLDESTHPDVLADGLDRERVFDALWVGSVGDDVRRRLFPYEVADLWAGDVPVFVGTPGSTDVSGSTGTRVPALLAGSGLAAATGKIATMGDVDRRQQEWLITAAMAIRTGPVDHRSGETVRGQAWEGPCPDRLLAAACCIGDEIVASAVRGAGRANWAGMELVDERHWAVLPMGAGLANGYCGVALFLAQLGVLTRADRYANLAREAVAPLPRLIEHLAAHPELAAAVGPGGFHGLGGICYALARLSRLFDDTELHHCLAAIVDLTAAADGGPRVDVGTGIAGALAAMTAVWAETGLPAAGRLARRYAEQLLSWRGADEAAPSGFVRGPAGVGWALLRHARAAGGEPFASQGYELVAMDAARPEPSNHAWCSGRAGVVLAEVAAADLGYPTDLTRRATTLAGCPPHRDTSLCHGELGIVEAVTMLADRGIEPATRALAQRRAWVLGTIDRHAHRCGTPDGVPTPGLLSGLAGIGYGLLRLGFATDVPSVLTFETGPGIVNQEMERQHAE